MTQKTVIFSPAKVSDCPKMTELTKNSHTEVTKGHVREPESLVKLWTGWESPVPIIQTSGCNAGVDYLESIILKGVTQ